MIGGDRGWLRGSPLISGVMGNRGAVGVALSGLIFTAGTSGPNYLGYRVNSNSTLGTIYGVLTLVTSSPTAAQLIAGTDATGDAGLGHINIASPAVGPNDASASAIGPLDAGLSCYWYLVQDDGAGHTSAVIASQAFLIPSIATPQGRRAALNVGSPWRSILPAPDTVVEKRDRQVGGDMFSTL